MNFGLKKIHFFYIALGIFIIVLYFFRLFWPVPALYSTPDFGHSDLWHFNIPMRKIYWEALQKNQLPYFDQRIGNGFPILAENQIGAFNLQNLILYRFLPFVTAFNLSYVLIFATAFIGCYLLFSEFRIIPFLSFAGALIFTFSGFFATHITHPNLIHTASYFPLLFFLLEKWTKSPSLSFPREARESSFYIILFIFFQAQCFLAGFPQFFLIINFFFFLYLFFTRHSFHPDSFPCHSGEGRNLCNKNGKKFWIPVFPQEDYSTGMTKIGKNNLIIFLISMVITLILCLPQIIPSLKFISDAGRSNGVSLDALSAFPYHPKHLLSFFNPYIFGNPKFGTYPVFNADWGIFWESTFYVGAATFIVYIVAVIFNFFGRSITYHAPTILSTHKTKSIFKIGLFSLFLGFGKYTPFFLIVQMPIFNMFRNPARFIFLFMFSVVFIAIMFLNKIIRYHKIFTIMTAAAVAELFFQFWSYHLILPAHVVLKPPEIIKYLKPNDLIFSYNPYENWNKVFLKKGWGSEREAKKYLFLKNQIDENMNILWNAKNFNVYASSSLNRQMLVNQKIYHLLNSRQKNNQIFLKTRDLEIFKKHGITVINSPYRIFADQLELEKLYVNLDLKIYFYRISPLPILSKNLNLYIVSQGY